MQPDPDRAGDHPILDPFEGVDLEYLEKSLMRPRTMFDALLNGVVSVMTGLALIPLVSVVWMLIVRGGNRLSFEALTEAPPAALAAGGGFGNALLGTLLMVGIAASISVPTGVLTGVYLAEAKDDDRFAPAMHFAAKVLTGLPSILAGVFTYGAVVMLTGGFSAVAGSVALSILMLPTIVLTSEEAIRRVPQKIRDAATGMGATPTQAVCMVLLPAATSGIITGVMLAVARAAGETAPLLFTALFSNYWLIEQGRVDLMQPTASLAVFTYNFAGVPYENQLELAWAAALVLVLLVLVTNLAGQALSPHRNN